MATIMWGAEKCCVTYVRFIILILNLFMRIVLRKDVETAKTMLRRDKMKDARFKKWLPPTFDEDGWAYSNDSHIKYGWRCQHFQNLTLGDETDVGCFTYMNAKHGIQIGIITQIGSNCSIYSESTIYGKYSGVLKGKVVIGDDVMIGAHCVIMPGVKIGNDAVVAACSFVNRDVPVGALFGGVPAVEINARRDTPMDMVDKKVRCVHCVSFMNFMGNEVERGRLVEFFRCPDCFRVISIKENIS